jgi:hypothetical protein
MAAAHILASTDSWTRSANGLPATRCLPNAPVEYSLQSRLSLVARAWVVQRLQQDVCYTVIHQVMELQFTRRFCFDFDF